MGIRGGSALSSRFFHGRVACLNYRRAKLTFRVCELPDALIGIHGCRQNKDTTQHEQVGYDTADDEKKSRKLFSTWPKTSRQKTID